MNRFLFHSVGQGLFYSGHLYSDSYNFVYDCGSSSNSKHINYAIDNLTTNEVIDFVVISHLHADHFSGLKRLFEKYKIRKIYLPYLGHGNRTLIKFLVAYSLFSKTSSMKEVNDNLISEESKTTYKFINDLYDLDDSIDKDLKVEFSGFNYEIINENNDGKIISKKTFSDSPYNKNWEWIMFNLRQPDAFLNSLNDKIDKLLVKHGVPDVDKLIFDNRIKDIIKIYNDVFKKSKLDLNLTSTILIHFPVNSMKFYYSFNHFCCSCYQEKPFYRKKPITILTGDVFFDSKLLKEVSDVIESHDLSETIFQVPHHGSKKNWDSLTKSYKFIFNHYVIPFGLNNKYNHPHKDVITELSTCKVKGVSIVTELSLFEYYIE